MEQTDTKMQDGQTEPEINNPTFNISFRTRGSDTVARRLLTVWTEAGRISDEDQTDMSVFAFALSVTNSADIGELKERIPATQEFIDWFSSLRDEKGMLVGLTDERCIEILDRLEADVPIVFFYNVWLQAYNQAQVLFPSVKTIAPKSSLTVEEREDEDLKKSESRIENAFAVGQNNTSPT